MPRQLQGQRLKYELARLNELRDKYRDDSPPLEPSGLRPQERAVPRTAPQLKARVPHPNNRSLMTPRRHSRMSAS